MVATTTASAGLDVAALTDHTTIFAVNGLSSSEWNTTATLANAANDPGQFTAVRGFEWSHPSVDATANGVRMGGVLPLATGNVRFLLDLDRGAVWDGKPLRIQVLRPGTTAPTVVDVIDTVNGSIADFTVPLNVADGNWVVLRISDPSQPNGQPGPAGHPCNDLGVAYTSPWWLQ